MTTVLIIALIVETVGIVLALAWLHDELGAPFPRQSRPSFVFRLVKRDERAVYVRIMRRTLAVATRDFGRAAAKMQREIARRLLPAFERLAADLTALLSRKP